MRKRGKLVVFAAVTLLVLAANLFTPLKVERLSIELKPEEIFSLGPLTVTNTLLSGWLATLLLAALALRVRKSISDTPAGNSVQNAIELVLEMVESFMGDFAGDKMVTFFPVIMTFFLYILLSNWLGLLPGFGSIGLWEMREGQRIFVPFLRGATSDLNTTAALAICSVLSSQIYGIKYLGVIPYLSKFVAIGKFVTFFKEAFSGKGIRPGLLIGGVIEVFVGILDLFEELTKTVSFSFRLFGNMFGGEVLLTVIAFLVPYVVSIPFLILEVFSGGLQALIFAALSTAFFTNATSPAHGGSE